MTPLCLGHRGHRSPTWPDEVENSLAAFDRALDLGCDGLELDLRLTADGRVVIHHDEYVRGPGRARIEVAMATLRALRRCQPSLATLDQVLRRHASRAWLDLEIKAPEALPAAVALIRQRSPQRGLVVSSFDPEVMRTLQRLAPEVPRCFNLRRPVPIAKLRAIPAQWIGPHHAACTNWYVRRLHAAGWKVLVWTVNRPAAMRRFARAPVDVIISDHPALLVQTLRPRTAPKQTG